MLLLPCYKIEITSGKKEAIRAAYSSPSLPVGDPFQNPRGTPETTNSIEPYMYYFFPIHT